MYMYKNIVCCSSDSAPNGVLSAAYRKSGGIGVNFVGDKN